jgi:magnesium-protoporphyrin O-methyltransferase
MATSYLKRRGQIEAYFDRTAVDAWKRLTSDAPVGKIRATVRAGRARMRDTLLSWLPADMTGKRLLDAGCGTGALAVEAARRGAHVTAIDLSPTLIGLARERVPRDLRTGQLKFLVGDMLDPALGRFDYIVAMDSLIHYHLPDAIRLLDALTARAETGLLFTFAPRTPALALMHALGRLFPRGERAPAIEPVAVTKLLSQLGSALGPNGWHAARTQRVSNGFYVAQALELSKR